jgi:hypothetical protein
VISIFLVVSEFSAKKSIMVKHAVYNRLISFHKNKSLAYVEFD